MKIPVRELTVGDILQLNDWQLHVVAVEHDTATAVLTDELGFLLHFLRDETVDIVGSVVRQPAAAWHARTICAERTPRTAHRTRDPLQHRPVRNYRGTAMLNIASEIAVRNTTEIAASALPDAPLLPTPPPRLRLAVAAFLRASAQRRTRLANRIDPCTGVVEPLAG